MEANRRYHTLTEANAVGWLFLVGKIHIFDIFAKNWKKKEKLGNSPHLTVGLLVQNVFFPISSIKNTIISLFFVKKKEEKSHIFSQVQGEMNGPFFVEKGPKWTEFYPFTLLQFYTFTVLQFFENCKNWNFYSFRKTVKL